MGRDSWRPRLAPRIWKMSWLWPPTSGRRSDPVHWIGQAGPNAEPIDLEEVREASSSEELAAGAEFRQGSGIYCCAAFDPAAGPGRSWRYR